MNTPSSMNPLSTVRDTGVSGTRQRERHIGGQHTPTARAGRGGLSSAHLQPGLLKRVRSQIRLISVLHTSMQIWDKLGSCLPLPRSVKKGLGISDPTLHDSFGRGAEAPGTAG
eukprot:scaffold119376_cov17-Tisochrysis_lutea.AAC.1